MIVEGPVSGKNIVGSIEHTVGVQTKFLDEQQKHLVKISEKIDGLAKYCVRMSKFFTEFDHALENECFDSMTLCASKQLFFLSFTSPFFVVI